MITRHAATRPVPGGPRPGSLVQRACSCGGTPGPTGECPACRRKRKLGLQTKLRVGTPGDRWEREADRTAERVASSSGAAGSLAISRVGPGSGGAPVADAAEVEATLNRPGRSLDSRVRTRMEGAFGHDFGAVRVHTDRRAAASAAALDARAYTVGRQIVFGAGEYQPSTAGGRHLLAHELTHVVQQGAAPGAQGGGGPVALLQRTSVTVEAGCPGTEAEINTAIGDARTGIARIADQEARDCIRSELDDATIVCAEGEGCGGTYYFGSTIDVHAWGNGCPSLPALLVHEAAHKCKFWWSEEFAEACESEAFGGQGATAPGPGEGGGTCEL